MNDAKIMNLARMARRLGVTQKWLRQQAEKGNVPSLRDGNRFIFNVEETTEAVAKMASTPHKQSEK